MKKVTLFLISLLFTIGLFAQNQGIVPRMPLNKALTEKTDPAVEITLGEFTSITVEASFAPNDLCASYYILISTAENMAMANGDLPHWWNLPPWRRLVF